MRWKWLFSGLLVVALGIVGLVWLCEIELWVSRSASRLLAVSLSEDGSQLWISHVTEIPHARRNRYEPPATVSVLDLKKEPLVFEPVLLAERGQRKRIVTDIFRNEIDGSAHSLRFGNKVYLFAEDRQSVKGGFVYIEKGQSLDGAGWGSTSWAADGNILVYTLVTQSPLTDGNPGTMAYSVGEEGLKRVSLPESPVWGLSPTSSSDRFLVWSQQDKCRFWYNIQTNRLEPVWREIPPEANGGDRDGLLTGYVVKGMSGDKKNWPIERNNSFFAVSFPEFNGEPLSQDGVKLIPLAVQVEEGRRLFPKIFNHEFVVALEKSNQLSIFSMKTGEKVWGSKEGHWYQRMETSVAGNMIVGVGLSSATVWRWDGEAAKPCYQIFVDMNGKPAIYPSDRAPKQAIEDGFFPKLLTER